MRICITGACGHLGSRLHQELAEANDVTILDNLSTGRYPSLYELKHPITFIEGDILTYDLDSLFRGVDVVIHLAAITDAPSTVNCREQTFEVNYHGAVRVAEACERNGCRMIFLSTTSVYGVSDGEVDEECQELKPQSPYAESKRASEQYLSDKEFATVLRCGTVYGVSVGMRWHTFVQKAVWLANLGQAITIWKTALHQERPYLALDDVVSAIKHVITNDLRGLYCVVTENRTPSDVVKVVKYFRPDAQIVLTDSPILNNYSYKVSNRRLRETGWSPVGNMTKDVSQMFSILSGVHG